MKDDKKTPEEVTEASQAPGALDYLSSIDQQLAIITELLQRPSTQLNPINAHERDKVVGRERDLRRNNHMKP